MDTRPCSFCSHENPEDAKFCNACGSSMHLQLCQRCGAIDNAAAVACYKCGASFSSQGANENIRPEPEGAGTRGAAPPASPSVSANPAAARASDRSPVRRLEQRKGGAARALLFVVIAAAAAFLYRGFTPSQEGEASDAAQARVPGLSPPGTIDATLGAVPPSSAILAAEVVPVKTPPPIPDVAQPPAADDPPPVDESLPPAGREASAATAADASRAPPDSYPCTPGVAALGLCN